MTTIHKLFGYSAAWNMLESVWYQLMLFGHQCALYHILSAAEYGKMGALFSLVYLGVALFNFGLDSSISPFFLHATRSKRDAWQSIILPTAIHFGMLSLIATTSIGALYVFGLPSFLHTIPRSFFILVGLIFISEALKKTVRTILHCAFKNHLTTATELATITSYIGTVWTLHFFGYPLNLYTLFIPMAITSLLSLTLLCFITHSWYNSLPDLEQSPPLTGRILKHRVCAYGTQLSNIFFSANFLVPLFAWQFGVEYAAILKLISYFTYFIHTIIHKVFGISLQACFAALKQEDISVKQRFFVTITNNLYQLLYGIFIFFAINHQRILSLKQLSLDYSAAVVGYLFLIGTLIENFLVSYEQLYQTEEKTIYLSMLNIINILLLGFFVTTHSINSPITFLLIFIALRLCTIAGIAMGAFYLWRIRLEWKPQITPTFCFVTLSLFFFLLTA